MNANEERAAAMLRTLDAIARDKLNVETLETRNSDGLDFHELAVWNIRQALCEAFMAGRRAADESDEAVAAVRMLCSAYDSNGNTKRQQAAWANARAFLAAKAQS